MRIILALVVSVLATYAVAETPWSITSADDWRRAQGAADKTVTRKDALVLQGAGQGQWTSTWRAWQGVVDSAEVVVDAEINLFDNKTIETLVKGSRRPFTGADGVRHDWYGRCMIAIVDANRWIMAIRSGVIHGWGAPDAIHLLTSGDEGRTWGKLNRWFDGTPIRGMPYEDGHMHSEPGLFRMPNGDLILQFWRTTHTTGTRQLRSTDQGKTWVADIDRIHVVGGTGAEDNRAIGTEDYFVDPENPSDVYMAFQYFHYNSTSGTLLAKSHDNGRSYQFLSWIGPLGKEADPDSGATFEPAIEYVGNRTIVAVMRDATGNRRTWQAISTDMGGSFGAPVDISDQVNGGVENGLWQRARLYKESNPHFQHNSDRLSHARGEGRLWGFGLHSMGGGYTRKPVVYWSDDNGNTWNGPELLHGPMHPGTDTGYGDLKRRSDGTFVAATYYANRDSTVADVEQYTFGGQRAKVMIEADREGDAKPGPDSGWRELCHGLNTFALSGLETGRWRLRLRLSSPDPAASPRIRRVTVTPRETR